MRLSKAKLWRVATADVPTTGRQLFGGTNLRGEQWHGPESCAAIVSSRSVSLRLEGAGYILSICSLTPSPHHPHADCSPPRRSPHPTRSSVMTIRRSTPRVRARQRPPPVRDKLVAHTAAALKPTTDVQGSGSQAYPPYARRNTRKPPGPSPPELEYRSLRGRSIGPIWSDGSNEERLRASSRGAEHQRMVVLHG
ncbi:hypothetical protein BD413DRAFT_90604 [Trametes elegans]|nr:hypothetical protein BD413DRAFT_90604 [Trametes elegans]